MRTILLRSSLVAALLVAGTAATAEGATITAEAGGYVYRGAPGETNRMLLYGGAPGTVRFYDENAIGDFPAECVQDRPNDAECPAGTVRVELGDGADTFALDSYAAGAISVDGGAGDDEIAAHSALAGATLEGGAGRDLLKGSEVDDVLRGGPGDDRLWGNAGDDELRGEDGADDLRPDNGQAPGNDVVDGGAGSDMVADWVETAAQTHPPISVSVDGVADDGRPGERDNVIDVERSSSLVSGRFVLSEAADDWQLFSNVDGGNATVFARGGDDRVVGEDHDETIDGGAGNDHLEGGRRNDTLTGGPGADTLVGDETDTGCTWAPEYCLVFGNDTIHARDGEADTIDCGPGTDRAIVDPIDVHSGCESVEAGGPGSTPGAPGGGPKGEPVPPAGGKVRLALVRTKLRRALRSGFEVRVTGAQAGKLSAHARRGRKVVARGSGRAGARGNAVVRLRFTKAARRTLRASRSLKLSVTVAGKTARMTLRR